MKRDLCYILSDPKTDIARIISDSEVSTASVGINTERIISSVINKVGKKEKKPFYKTALYRNIGVVAACFVLVIGIFTALSLSGIIDFGNPEIIRDVAVNLDDKNIVWKNTTETGAAIDTSAIHEIIPETGDASNDTKKHDFSATGTWDASEYSIVWNGINLDPAFFFVIEESTDEEAIFALLAGEPTKEVAETYEPDKAKNDYDFFRGLDIPVMFDENAENVFIFVTKEQLASLSNCAGIENFRFSQATRDEVGYHEDIAIEPEAEGLPSRNDVDDKIVTMVTEGYAETVGHEAVDEYLYDSSDVYSDETGQSTPAYDPNK